MEVSLRRIVVGYRAIAAIWLTVLALIALTRDEPQRPQIVMTTVVVVVVWTSITVWLSYRAPQALRSIAFLAVDFVLSFGVLIAPDVASSADFYGGYPASSIFLAAYAVGLPGAVAATTMLSAVSLWRALGPRSGDAVFVLVTSVVVYPFIAAPAAWAIGVLRRTDRLRREAEAALDIERADRIRAEERAELAAHLHDSVLQSLALIQRNPHDSTEVVTIARRQERDLRRWLFDTHSELSEFGEAVAAVVSEVEQVYRIKIEAVVVGDGPLDRELEALLAAAREAIINGAKHSGAIEMSVYAEIDDEQASIFVRDRGVGFDPDTVPDDRRGLTESIHGRMRRSGGSSRVISTPGQGTEVTVSIPRPSSATIKG